ncbi:coiled-coil domain-containing protein 178 isoform X2 [Mauremys reevesii]|uniref:coiled-coil domain-containing protein 178 isoform X2 n=1 Tax=Mauremys reevesii TaxID=260615 RepID=UPI00193FE67F|nr:coiled-coil domain-containing protein 178 isoform X2 [Mauremys reevesii]
MQRPQPPQGGQDSSAARERAGPGPALPCRWADSARYKVILATVLEMESLSCSSEDGSQPSHGKNKEMLLGYPTRRRSCALVNTPSPCVNKAIHHIQELEVKIESSFQQHDCILEKEKIPWTLTLKQETEAVLSEVIELIKRLEAEGKEAEEALKREKQRKKKLVMKIDCMSIWRLQQFPIAVQKEHEICTQDISELQWHFDCANRQLQQVKAQVLKIETVNGRIQEDIDFMKKYSPLLEEKLNLEGDAMKDVLLAHGKASKLYYDVYRELLRIQQILKQVTEEAEKERKSMSEKIKYAEIVLKQYQNDLKHSEFLWTELCIKLKETEEKIIKEERHLEELVKQKEEIQEDTKSWNNNVQDLNNKTLAQENENKSLLDACSEVIKVMEDLKTSWGSEQFTLKQMLLNTLQAVDELERENKELERENEEYVQKSRESSRRKITYQSELQIICKNTRKIEEQIRKVNKELYNIEMTYGEGKIKVEELEEKIIREKIRYKNLEENIKKLIRDERGTWQLTQARIKAMYGELEQKKKDSAKIKEETIKRIADIEGPVAELEAQFIENKNIHKENIEKLYNLNQRMQKLDEQKKQAEQQLEHKKSTVKNQLTDIQEKYSDVTSRLDETTHIIENFQNRIHELNELAETKQRQIETTEKSLIELRENFSAVSCKQEKNQMLIDYLQNELGKYEKRIQHEEKTYGELLWTRQKNLEEMKITLEQMIKENLWLSQEYQIFQKYYLNDKENLMDLYDDRVKVEAAVRDHQQLSVLQSRMHRALVEYFKQRGLYSQAGLAKFQAASHENAQKILAVQTHFKPDSSSLTVGQITMWGHVLYPSGSSWSTSGAQCHIGSILECRESKAFELNAPTIECHDRPRRQIKGGVVKNDPAHHCLLAFLDRWLIY